MIGSHEIVEFVCQRNTKANQEVSMLSRHHLTIVLTLIVSLSASQANAAVFTRVVKNYYDVKGNTGHELKQQMNRNGPKGFWAYTTWYVRWTSNCVVNLKITYTYPRLANRETAPKQVVKNWDKMMKHLVAHEENHGNHGVQAAKEISENKCRKGKAITRRWAQEDKNYDKRTHHGAKEGISLAD